MASGQACMHAFQCATNIYSHSICARELIILITLATKLKSTCARACINLHAWRSRSSECNRSIDRCVKVLHAYMSVSVHACIHSSSQLDPCTACIRTMFWFCSWRVTSTLLSRIRGVCDGSLWSTWTSLWRADSAAS